MSVAMTIETNTLSYWLNWRFLVCAIWVLSPMVAAAIVIWKYEGKDSETDEEILQETKLTLLYEDETWRPCLKEIHPAWLLAFRIISFVSLLAFLVANIVVDGGVMFLYYTQWTFTSVTIYFGLGSLFSIYGCYQYCTGAVGDPEGLLDAERGTYVALAHEENGNDCNINKSWVPQKQHHVRQTAGIWCYIFQILFQMNAGAVILTDSVYWLILFPLLSENKDYSPTVFLIVMHSVNAVFLLVDAILNCLHFPWFRMAYFILWTGIFVVFQWVLHACVSMWWPYPFLDLSSPYSPLWYLAVAVLHLPSYAFFVLIVRTKHFLLSRWFPNSYQCTG